MRVGTTMIVGLDEPAAADVAVAGGKAATLARLRQEGLAVPTGFVVTADATAPCLERAGDDAPDGSGDVRPELPEPLRAAIGEALDDLGPGPVAVRSSALDEDHAAASFAGQYATVLDVEGTCAVIDAVRTVLASVRSARVATYREAAGAPRTRMAVLVQRLVPAEVAGVAFSANPVTGDRSETVVSAVEGLGETLVSGETTPDEMVVRDEEVVVVSRPCGVMDDDLAREVARLVERLEDLFGRPQDIEWARTGGELALLQARPITALPREPHLDIPAQGSWTKDVSHYPELLTPLGASIYLPLLDAGLNRMFDEYGLLIERIENRCIGGEVYGRAIPVGGKEGPPPPWWVLAVLVRIVPPIRARMRTAARVVAEGRLERVPALWERRWRDEFRGSAAALRRVELAQLDDAALAAHLDDAIALLERGQRVHFELFPAYVVGVHELARACRELLGWEPIEAMDLLAGTSAASSEPSRALADLAERIRAHPTVDADDGTPADLVEQLERSAPELAAAFRDHLERYAHRALNYDPGAPTLIERPQLLASLLHEAVRAEDRDPTAGSTERRTSAERRAEKILASRPAAERERFRAVLERARRVYPLREDNVFWTDNLPCGLIRRAAVEIGRRLAARDRLHRPDDVAFLEIDEVRTGLVDDTPDLAETATRRRAERAWVAAHPGPDFHGDEPTDLPDVRGLPEAGRLINRAFLWIMDQEYRATPRVAERGLGGVPGSPGRYTGPARVVTDEAGFERLRPGDVLVAPITTPVWSVLFTRAGAVVTDGGGTLSHAAIVAREHGIPAVLATETATTTLRDGQTVTVDGGAGTVTFEEETS